jgi:Ca2+-binding EF-hand superfamily protein
MGCSSSQFDLQFKHASHCRHLDIFCDRLRVPTKQLKALFRVFGMIDQDFSNSIDLDEFFDHFDLEYSFFANRAFSVMNVDRDPSSPAQLDFAEFFVGVFNYCTLTHDTLVKFAFDLFDKDGSGAIARDELEQLVEIVYGQAAVDEKASKVIRMMDRDRDGLVELLEFRQIERRVPSLLKPAFELQQQLQQKLLGRKFWNGATRRRCANMGSEDLIEWYFALKNGEALVRLEVNEEAAGRQELEREQMLQQGEVLNPEGVHALGGPSANAERLHIVPFQTRFVCYAKQRVEEEGPPPADPETDEVGVGVGSRGGSGLASAGTRTGSGAALTGGGGGGAKVSPRDDDGGDGDEPHLVVNEYYLIDERGGIWVDSLEVILIENPSKVDEARRRRQNQLAHRVLEQEAAKEAARQAERDELAKRPAIWLQSSDAVGRPYWHEAHTKSTTWHDVAHDA